MTIRPSATLVAEAKTQTRFALQNALAAASFHRRVAELEDNNRGQRLGSFFDEILWSATACIFCTSASLEAYANEVFEDREKHFPEHAPTVIAEIWDRIEKEPSLDKLAFALVLRNAPAFDRGSPPFQNAAALIRLRNALTHFKPEWTNSDGEHARISSKLENLFDGTPFITGDRGLFPRRWASRSCTGWAVKSLIGIVLEFEKNGGLRTNVAEKLATLSEDQHRL